MIMIMINLLVVEKKMPFRNFLPPSLLQSRGWMQVLPHPEPHHAWQPKVCEPLPAMPPGQFLLLAVISLPLTIPRKVQRYMQVSLVL